MLACGTHIHGDKIIDSLRTEALSIKLSKGGCDVDRLRVETRSVERSQNGLTVTERALGRVHGGSVTKDHRAHSLPGCEDGHQGI